MIDYLSILEKAVDSLFYEICNGAQFDILWQFVGHEITQAKWKLFKKIHI